MLIQPPCLAARSMPLAVLLTALRGDVLAAALRGSWMNNQCSTRKAVDAEADDRCLTAPGAP